MEAFFKQLKDKMYQEKLKLSQHTLPTLLEYAVHIVEYSELRGHQKKQTVLFLLEKLIQDSNLELHNKEKILTLLKSKFISDTIDSIVLSNKLHKSCKQHCCIIV